MAPSQPVQADKRGIDGAIRVVRMGNRDQPLSPLARNDSEDGQAKNRRVELVKQ